jgi:hypothetical protein
MSANTCPKCGGERPPGEALVLCPKCLLAEGVAGAERLTDEQTLAVPAANVMLAPGQLPFRALGGLRVDRGDRACESGVNAGARV